MNGFLFFKLVCVFGFNEITPSKLLRKNIDFQGEIFCCVGSLLAQIYHFKRVVGTHCTVRIERHCDLVQRGYQWVRSKTKERDKKEE
jgi:hypothetical protein